LGFIWFVFKAGGRIIRVCLVFRVVRKFATFDVYPVEMREPTGKTRELNAVEFAREKLGFEADERQAEVLLSESKRGILNCSRQWGKSTVAAAKAVYRAYTKAECLVLVASPSGRQSRLFVRKAAGMMRKLGMTPRRDGDNSISILFPNGSRIVGVPGNEETIRGYSGVSMLLVDEAARVSDEMFTALRPMLAVEHGDLWLMSTPKGRSGFFYDAWEHGGSGWHRVQARATECGRIGAVFLEEQRGSMDSAEFRQEYMTEFVDDGSEMFDREVVEAALDSEERGLKLRLRFVR
jgi:hypothetical protein